MSIAPKQIGLQAAIANMATGGAITLPGTTRIEQYRALTVNQTTAAQTLQLPAPIDTSIIFSLTVSNIGTAAFTMHAVTVAAGSTTQFTWNGSVWASDTELSSTAPPVPTAQTLTPTAQNTLPALGSTPKVGYPVIFNCNGVEVAAGGITNSGTALTVTAATVGHNIETTDTITVLYWV